MKTINEVLTYVKASLKNEISNLSVENSHSFYRITFENGLVGLVYSALKSNVLEDEVFKRLEQNFFAYLKKDNEQQLIIKEVTTLFETNKIHYALLKGAHLKSLYSESYLRGMGDFDILVLKEDYEKAQKVLKMNNYFFDSISLAHAVFEKDNVMVEVHPLLENRNDSKFDPLLETIENYLVKDNFQMTIKPEAELLYLIYHLEKHLKTGGIGLRSVLDIGIFLKAYEKKINDDLLITLVNELNVKTFVTTIIALNEYLFDFKFKLKLMENHNVNNNTLERLTKHITISGVHGTGNQFNEFSVRVINEGNNNRFKFLMSRLFPSIKEMKGFYPVLNKAIILLPFCYVARFFKIVFFRGRSNYQKLKKTRKASVEQSVVDLFKDIDII